MIVYRAVHQASGKSYVGQSTGELKQRIRQHAKSKQPFPFPRALRKHGKAAFLWMVLWEGDSQAEADRQEKEWIERLNCLVPHGYNLKLGGNGGGKHSPQTRALQSALKKGKVTCWRKGLTKETDERVRQAAEITRGVPKTEKHRRKLSQAKRGKANPFVSASNRRRSGAQSATSKEWIVTTPTGEEIRLRGIQQFCEERNLRRCLLGATARGERNHHKGYRARLLEGRTVVPQNQEIAS